MFSNFKTAIRVQITHCSGCLGQKTRVHAASSWPHDSLPWVLIYNLIEALHTNAANHLDSYL